MGNRTVKSRVFEKIWHNYRPSVKTLPLHKAKKHLTITGMKTVEELNSERICKKIYRQIYKYRKVMIGLNGLEHDIHPQLDMFNTQRNIAKLNKPLMQTFDAINNKYGRSTMQ